MLETVFSLMQLPSNLDGAACSQQLVELVQTALVLLPQLQYSQDADQFNVVVQSAFSSLLIENSDHVLAKQFINLLQSIRVLSIVSSELGFSENFNQFQDAASSVQLSPDILSKYQKR